VAHWTLLERIDVTSEFTRCMEVLLDESRERQSALVELLGEKDYAERVERRSSTRAAVEFGLLRREIFLATRPSSPASLPELSIDRRRR
jgi:hypothetical protein